MGLSFVVFPLQKGSNIRNHESYSNPLWLKTHISSLFEKPALDFANKILAWNEARDLFCPPDSLAQQQTKCLGSDFSHDIIANYVFVDAFLFSTDDPVFTWNIAWVSIQEVRCQYAGLHFGQCVVQHKSIACLFCLHTGNSCGYGWRRWSRVFRLSVLLLWTRYIRIALREFWHKCSFEITDDPVLWLQKKNMFLAMTLWQKILDAFSVASKSRLLIVS